MSVYELWDIESGNLLGEFDDAESAQKAKREFERANPESSGDRFFVGEVREDR